MRWLLLCCFVGSCSRPFVPATALKPAPTCTRTFEIGGDVPAEALACATAQDCVKATTTGCCAVRYGAVASNAKCIANEGASASCDRVCDAELSISPEGGAAMVAACVKGQCSLVMP